MWTFCLRQSARKSNSKTYLIQTANTLTHIIDLHLNKDNENVTGLLNTF